MGFTKTFVKEIPTSKLMSDFRQKYFSNNERPPDNLTFVSWTVYCCLGKEFLMFFVEYFGMFF